MQSCTGSYRTCRAAELEDELADAEYIANTGAEQDGQVRPSPCCLPAMVFLSLCSWGRSHGPSAEGPEKGAIIQKAAASKAAPEFKRRRGRRRKR